MSKQWGFRDTDRPASDNRRGGRQRGARLFGRVNRDISDAEIGKLIRQGKTEAQILRALGEISPSEKNKVNNRVKSQVNKHNQGKKK